MNLFWDILLDKIVLSYICAMQSNKNTHEKMENSTQTTENQTFTFTEIADNINKIQDENANAFTIAGQMMRSLKHQTITSAEFSRLSDLLELKCKKHNVETENEIASLFERKSKADEFTEMLQNTAACRGLEIIENTISGGGITVCKEKHSFKKYDVLIVRSQWSKTQGGFGIRVNNYYQTKRHFIQIPMQTMKQCRQVIQDLNETGKHTFWTNHTVDVINDTQSNPNR
jgi:hypothetical protein